jgi:hypothetical protein
MLKDMKVLKAKNWKEFTRNRKEWNKLVQKTKTHHGLQCCRRRRTSLEQVKVLPACGPSRKSSETVLQIRSPPLAFNILSSSLFT